MESSSIEAVPPSLDFSSYPLQPPIPNSPSKEGITMNTVIDQTFPLSRDAFFLLFFSDDALLSMRDYHLSRGDSEFLISSWRGVEGEGREVYQRELSLRVVVTDKSAFAPKSTRCLKIQRRMVDDDQAILINTTTVSLDVPWADCFFVQESWRIIDEPPLCRVHASYGWKFLSIPFSLKMAKGIAESRMHIDLKGSINDWAKLANNYISTHNDEIIYVNRAAKLKEKKLSTIRMKEIVQMPDTEFVGEAKKNNDNANLSNTNTTTPSSITSPPTLPSSDSSDVSLLPHLPHSPVIAAVMFFFLLMTLRFGSIDAFLMTIIIGLLSIIVVQNQRIDDRLQQTNRLLATQIGNSRSPPSSS